MNVRKLRMQEGKEGGGKEARKQEKKKRREGNGLEKEL